MNGMYTWADRTPETGDKVTSPGFFVQAGKLFHRRQYEVACRYGQYDPNDIVDNNLVKEVRGAFSYYYARHGLKWQNDIGQVETQAGRARSTRSSSKSGRSCSSSSSWLSLARS